MLDGRRHRCGYREHCKQAVEEAGHDFVYGQLSHVGKRYDLIRDGNEIRLVIGGISVGRRWFYVNMGKRYKQILQGSGMEENFVERNPHMRGTSLLVRRILLGPDSWSDFREKNSEFLTKVHRQENHMFNYFGLVNLVLCSAMKNESTDDKSTTIMRKNCANHFEEAIRILEPTIVVFQSENHFSRLIDKWKDEGVWEEYSPYCGSYKRGRLEFLTFTFGHPLAWQERGWGRYTTRLHPYFTGTINKVLSYWLRYFKIE